MTRTQVQNEEGSRILRFLLYSPVLATQAIKTHYEIKKCIIKSRMRKHDAIQFKPFENKHQIIFFQIFLIFSSLKSIERTFSFFSLYPRKGCIIIIFLGITGAISQVFVL